jgi:hypothetical protein
MGDGRGRVGGEPETKGGGRDAERHAGKHGGGRHEARARRRWRGGNGPGRRLRRARLERQPRLADVAQPPFRVALEAAREQRHDRYRCRGRQRRPVRCAREHGSQGVADRLAAEERAARQHLVEHAPERPDVGALVHGAAARLFGRHVRGGAEDHPVRRHRRGARDGGRVGERRRALPAGCPRGGGGIERLRQPEIQHLHGAVGPHLDVRGLEVAVDDAGVVGGFERFGDLPRDRQRLVGRHRTARDALSEILAVDELHDDRAGRRLGRTSLARLFDAVHLRDVGVIEGGERLRLSVEARQPLGVARDEWRHDLQRHVAMEPRVARAVHLSHAALADERGHFVRAETGTGRERHWGETTALYGSGVAPRPAVALVWPDGSAGHRGVAFGLEHVERACLAEDADACHLGIPGPLTRRPHNRPWRRPPRGGHLDRRAHGARNGDSARDGRIRR